MPSISINTSTSQPFSNIWSSGASDSFSDGRFLGLAHQGFGTYEGGNTLPAYFNASGDWRSPRPWNAVPGFGFGGSAQLRAGVNLGINGTAGSAQLNLNDRIKLDWARENENITIKSTYDYQPSTLKVVGPRLQAFVQGRLDSQFSAHLNYAAPFDGWRKTGISLPSAFNNSNPLFEYRFDSKDPLQLGLGYGSLKFHGVNLDTAVTTQLARGVQSSVNNPILSASLDLDKLLVPGGLSYSFPGGRLSLADIGLNMNANVWQHITANVDTVTGLYKMENGEILRATVGTPLTVPIAQYDANGDGQLSVRATFIKWGSMSNQTSLWFGANAGANFLSASLGGLSIGPFATLGPWNLGSQLLPAYSNSWTARLGSSEAHSLLLA